MRSTVHLQHSAAQRPGIGERTKFTFARPQGLGACAPLPMAETPHLGCAGGRITAPQPSTRTAQRSTARHSAAGRGRARTASSAGGCSTSSPTSGWSAPACP